ncbi:restriction endonuclease subunit S [Streptomyces spororaveus]|uniref:restriction endonuclease subunit S n=1 Tax=Streptomyces spororaveus TaxID=284039 RepID=UPI0020794885|nr:restriction endonuclease subunit S [Streptomyces spororaveus]MCM9080080.1 restriction endonuclease subunit S [Streptomyces spororaveus]
MTLWNKVRLKHLCLDAGQYGLNTSAENYAESGTRLLRTTDISSGTLSSAEEGVFVSGTPEERFALKEGDLLLSRSGTPPGQSYLIRAADEGMTFAGYLVRFRPRPSVDPRFLAYVAQSAPFQHTIRSESVASTIQNFNAERYANIEFRAPNPTEQRHIADFLDAETARMDRLHRATERQQQLVAERQIVAFHDSVQSEGGPDLNSSEPATNNSGWRMLPLNHALNQLTNGYVGPTRDLFVDDGVRYLQSLHIKNGRINFARKPYFVKKDWAEERPRIRLGFEDLLIVQTGAIGEVGLVDEEYVGASCHALLIARTHRSLLAPRYLWHAFRSHWGRSALLREQTGALHPHLEAGNVRFMKIPVPSLDTQRRVVARTEEIAKDTVTVERALSRRLTLQSERRQALITAAVTGQFDVTTASGRNVTDGVTA